MLPGRSAWDALGLSACKPAPRKDDEASCWVSWGNTQQLQQRLPCNQPPPPVPYAGLLVPDHEYFRQLYTYMKQSPQPWVLNATGPVRPPDVLLPPGPVPTGDVHAPPGGQPRRRHQLVPGRTRRDATALLAAVVYMPEDEAGGAEAVPVYSAEQLQAAADADTAAAAITHKQQQPQQQQPPQMLSTGWGNDADVMVLGGATGGTWSGSALSSPRRPKRGPSEWVGESLTMQGLVETARRLPLGATQSLTMKGLVEPAAVAQAPTPVAAAVTAAAGGGAATREAAPASVPTPPSTEQPAAAASSSSAVDAGTPGPSASSKHGNDDDDSDDAVVSTPEPPTRGGGGGGTARAAAAQNVDGASVGPTAELPHQVDGTGSGGGVAGSAGAGGGGQHVTTRPPEGQQQLSVAVSSVGAGAGAGEGK
ncbi:hypothetical protein FOA52_010244 [Chlamydomonas sp. UWO 241]|nr:hypothetical protein FOA52_010244 [Chlamydomonas sp. UWO 241]